jgi:hypothetical protein
VSHRPDADRFSSLTRSCSGFHVEVNCKFACAEAAACHLQSLDDNGDIRSRICRLLTNPFLIIAVHSMSLFTSALLNRPLSFRPTAMAFPCSSWKTPKVLAVEHIGRRMLCRLLHVTTPLMVLQVFALTQINQKHSMGEYLTSSINSYG